MLDLQGRQGVWLRNEKGTRNMKDVKVDVRVNVGVDMAGVVLLLASTAMALFFYKQNRQEKLK